MDRLIGDLGPRARRNAPVARVRAQDGGINLVYADGAREAFDEVVIACHSDQALRLLADPSPERASAARRHPLPGQPGAAAPRPGPDAARASGLVVLELSERVGRGRVAVGQRHLLDEPPAAPGDTDDYFVSLNPLSEPREESIAAEFEYEHPVFTTAALQAQKQLHRIQGRARTWFAGAWTGYGFHEDGMRSGVEVAQALGATAALGHRAGPGVERARPWYRELVRQAA